MKNASLPRRLGSMLYDSLLLLAILFVATVPFIAVRDGEFVSGSRLYQLCMLAVAYAFFVGFWVGSGANARHAVLAPAAANRRQ